jgi:hypothetical protein
MGPGFKHRPIRKLDMDEGAGPNDKSRLGAEPKIRARTAPKDEGRSEPAARRAEIMVWL